MSPRRSVIPAADLDAIRRYCDVKTPPEHSHQFRVEFGVRGKSVTIYDCQPPWGPEFGPDWIRSPAAQLRFDPDSGEWQLHFADRNSRWHIYDDVDPTPDVAALLAEIDRDPTGIFWG